MTEAAMLTRGEMLEKLNNSGLSAQLTALQRCLIDLLDRESKDELADFHVRLTRPRGLRRWVRPQAGFVLDGFVLLHAVAAEIPGVARCALIGVWDERIGDERVVLTLEPIAGETSPLQLRRRVEVALRTTMRLVCPEVSQ